MKKSSFSFFIACTNWFLFIPVKSFQYLDSCYTCSYFLRPNSCSLSFSMKLLKFWVIFVRFSLFLRLVINSLKFSEDLKWTKVLLIVSPIFWRIAFRPFCLISSKKFTIFSPTERTLSTTFVANLDNLLVTLEIRSKIPPNMLT